MSLLSAVTRGFGRIGLSSPIPNMSKAYQQARSTALTSASSRSYLGHGFAARSVSCVALTTRNLLKPFQPLQQLGSPGSLSQPMAPLVQQLQARTFASRRFHKKKIIRLAKGYRGRTNCYRIAIRRVEKAWMYAYRDRKMKKREMRKLWIERLNAGVRQHGLTYSKFINMLHKSGVSLNRRMLADLAGMEPFSFKAVVDVVKMRSKFVG
uniref:50S ribosomal protein L20 n=1 Tax=Odontella aurita TaxID=265563 RepID=A0A7S4J449_9STRA|mmetsp:Transcript_38006/g.113519  ORF Transcript_38006/g.113519 Transcript_38006/m.113519 type:complete len:209 (+) Transcript_38006:127-753(+)